MSTAVNCWTTPTIHPVGSSAVDDEPNFLHRRFDLPTARDLDGPTGLDPTASSFEPAASAALDADGDDLSCCGLLRQAAAAAAVGLAVGFAGYLAVAAWAVVHA